MTEQFKQEMASILELVELAHNPELAEVECGSVYQIWGDGEITVQKCGSLLWGRTLHRTIGGIEGLKLKMPCEYGVHTYAFVTELDYKEIGRQIVNFLLRYPQIGISTNDIERYQIWMGMRRFQAA